MAKRTRPSGVEVRVQRLAHADGLPLPAYQTAGAAGLDLLAAVPATAPVLIAPGARVMIETGLVLELPAGTEGQVRPRSGLAVKHGITVLNSPGTIDCDYRGEVKIMLVNLGSEPFLVQRGERIAQLVIARVEQARLKVVGAVGTTRRGAGGFGSTGVAGQRETAGGSGKKGTKKKAMPGARAATKRRPRSERRTRIGEPKTQRNMK